MVESVSYGDPIELLQAEDRNPSEVKSLKWLSRSAGWVGTSTEVRT